MDVTAQNTNVNDIWSLPDQPTQTPQANSADDQNQPTPQKPSGGSFGKPGVLGGGEGGGSGEAKKTWETDPAVAEIYKSEERQKPLEAVPPLEILKTPEASRSPEVQKSPESLRSPEAQKPRSEENKKDLEPQVIKAVAPEPKIIDQRTGKEKTHRVDINKADAVTKTADIKEQGFIEGVEQVHSII